MAGGWLDRPRRQDEDCRSPMLATLSVLELALLTPVVLLFVGGTVDVFRNGSRIQRRVAALLVCVLGVSAAGIWLGGR